MPSQNYTRADQAWYNWSRRGTGSLYYNTGADLAWYGWVTTAGTTTSTQYITANQTWQLWVNQTGAATTQTLLPTYANEAWNRWTFTPTLVQQPQVTAEQIAAEAERLKRYEEERKAAAERKVAARTRARLLLDSVLSAEQKHDLDTHGRFHVTGSRGRRYCIRAAGQSGNVDLLKPDGSVQARLCAHPTYTHDRPGELVPEGDAWLAQMLEIACDEDNFLAKANVHAGSLPPDAPRRHRAHGGVLVAR